MMYLCSPDTHIRSSAPENRTDPSFLATVLHKFKFMLDYAWKEGRLIMLHPGDFFDSPTVPYGVTREIINLIKLSGITIFAVYGQHDLRYRSDRNNTPLALLEAAGCVKILSAKPYMIGHCYVYGASFGEEIPKVVDVNATNILVTHRMIIDDEKLWKQQTDHTWANHILSRNSFDLIVSGDNHKCFQITKSKKILVNAGAMLRTSVAQVDHVPSFFDVRVAEKGKELFTVKQVTIPHRPIKEVMNVAQIKEQKQRNAELEAFIEGLRGDREISLDFLRSLLNRMKSLDEDLARVIQEGIDGVSTR